MYIKENLHAKFIFLPPFDVNNTDIKLSVTGKNNIEDLQIMGVDVFATTYEPLGIARSVFDADVVMKIKLVTLVNEKMRLFIPESYINIANYNEHTLVSRRLIAIDIGAIPVSESITPLLNELVLKVEKDIGITPSVKELYISREDFVTKANIDAFNVNRGIKKVDSSNSLIHNAELEAQLVTSLNTETQLKCVIEALVCGNATIT